MYMGWPLTCPVGSLCVTVADKFVQFIGAEQLEVLLMQSCAHPRCVPRQLPPSPQLERPGGFSASPGKALVLQRVRAAPL